MFTLTILLKMFGRNSRTIFSEQYRPDATAEELDAYGKEKEALYREACIADPESFHLADGVYEMLEFMKANKIPYNLATGSNIDNLEFYFKELDLGRWFSMDKIVYDDGSMRGKPFPDVYIEAARKIGLEPQECIVFEDAKSGIMAANSAGAGAVYAVVSENLVSPVTNDVSVNGEIKDFKGYLTILKRHQII